LDLNMSLTSLVLFQNLLCLFVIITGCVFFPGRLKQQLEELQAVTKLVFPLDYVYVFRIFHDQNLLVYIIQSARTIRLRTRHYLFISLNQAEQSALERGATAV
jgi:hypothetical protein